MMKLNGNLEMLEERLSGQDELRLLHKATEIGRHITAMAEFTRTYEDIGVRAPAWQDVHTLISKASSTTHVKEVEIVNDVPPGSEVMADPLIIKVFYNLIENAIIYGEKITQIKFTLEPSSSGMRIVCTDDGVGIPEEMRKNLFTRGYGKGHGLGLFLSKEILSITGMTISECGEPGEGARFVIEVPGKVFRKTRA
jgi:signal transduction histidine kinase